MAKIGKTINGYKLVSLINSGSFCEAYLATKGGKEYFVKEYTEPTSICDGSDGSVSYKDFVDHQKRMIAKLNRLGDTIEQTLECFEDKLYYQVKPFIHGASLDNWIEDPANKSYETRRAIAAMICDTLTIIHEAGIIHKDLKPGQYMVVKDSCSSCGLKLILMDFDWSITDGIYLRPIATLGYNSLEQDISEISEKCDIFSLGIMLSELLVGINPYAHNDHEAGLTDKKWYNWVVNKRYRQPKEICSWIPDAINDIIVKCLDPKPSNRPTIDEIKAVLEGKSGSSKYAGIRITTDDGVLIIPIKSSVEPNSFASAFPAADDGAGNNISRYLSRGVKSLIVSADNENILLSTEVTKNKLMLNGKQLSITPTPVNDGDILELYSVNMGKTIARFTIQFIIK